MSLMVALAMGRLCQQHALIKSVERMLEDNEDFVVFHNIAPSQLGQDST
jgi:hypothetical protein